MGILDILSSAPKKNPYSGLLSDEAWQFYQQMQRRQRVGQALRGVGNTLSRAAYGLPPNAQGGGGRGGGSQDALIRAMQMDRAIEARQDRDAARQDKAAERQRQKTKDEANAAIIAKIRGQSGPVGPETPVRGYPGATPVTAQALPPKRPVSGLRNDPEFLANLMATSPKVATGFMFPKTKPVEYGKPMTVRQGDKDVLARFSKTGKAPPKMVEGYGPSQRPDKDSRTAVQKNVPYLAKVMGISEKDAAALVTQSRSMSPQQFRQKVFLAYMSSWDATAEEAAKQADAAMKLFYPQTAPAAPQGPTPPAGGGGLLSNLYRSFNPSAGAATPSGGRTPPPTERQKRRASQAAAQVQTGQTVTIEGKPYEVLNENPDGTVTIMDLATGESFIAR